jgi:Predicted periplasmic lipoprotein (DUF2279)
MCFYFIESIEFNSMQRFFICFYFTFILNQTFIAQSDTNALSSILARKDTNFSNKSSINKPRLALVTSGVSAMYIGSMAYLQYVWYKDSKRVPFEFYKDFKGYNQIDKFGHVYGAYMQSYIGFHSLLWSGVSRKKAALIGGSLGFFMQLPIEVWDGLYEGWGFSWSDVGANTLGSVLVIGQELAFKEQIVKYKFTFKPSPYAKQANGYLGNGFDEIFYDYNGHTYWLSTSVNKIIPSKKIPEWLCLSLGYGAGGMFGEFENIQQFEGIKIPQTERYRKFLMSLDIDFTKIKTKRKWLKKLCNHLFMIKVPFPAIEYNSKGQFKMHALYY